MQEHRIDGVQLTQQLLGIWVSAHYVSQLELTEILQNFTLFVILKSYHFNTGLTSLNSLKNLRGSWLGKNYVGNG